MTLPANLASNPRSKFIILNYNTEDDLVDFVHDECAAEIESGRVGVYTYPVQTKFRMAHAKNMAHRLGIREGAEVLVNLDADNLAGDRFEDFLSRELADGHDFFFWARMLRGILPRGISGRIAVSHQAFVKAGGYDEAKFSEWGSDDKDFNIRLKRLGYEGIEIPPSFLRGILHNDRVRFREYPHLAQVEDEAFRVDASTVGNRSIANNGMVGVGRVFRNRNVEDVIALPPLPTRVFGIGLHKTATTSLHHAFGILGYDSWHWSSAHDAKAIWQQMNTAGYSPTLERYYALTDLPIPLLYRKLDEAYPGSKFILTVRSENDWLETVRKHWHPRFNKFRAGWDDDPFSHRVHELLYGRTDFDAATFLTRYRRHTADVLEYFKDRPDDLLVMDMDSRPGWEGLCRFLDRPIPDIPYPHAYRTVESS